MAKATHQFSHSLPISCPHGGEREINKYEKLKEKKYVSEVWANLSVLICFLYCSDMFPDSENSIKIMCQKKLKCYSLKWEKKFQWLLLCGQLPALFNEKLLFNKASFNFSTLFISLFTNYFASFNTGEKSRYCYASDDVKDQAYWVSCAKVEWERENYLVIIV